MVVEIVDALDGALRESVFQFRYDVYVLEMGRTQKHADHVRRRIEDPLDASADLLAAREVTTSRVVGTVRTNNLGHGPVGPYEKLYGLERLSSIERRRTSITTRLMVGQVRRGTALAVQLACELYARAVRSSVETDYIDCNEHLVPFFEGLGYQGVRPVSHPEYGPVMLMAIEVQNITALKRVGSPFAKVYERVLSVVPASKPRPGLARQAR